MADTLATVVENVIDRVVVLEPLAVPDASYATKRWIEFMQNPPYWTNRVGAMTGPYPGRGAGLAEYELQVHMWLILAHHAKLSQLYTDDVQQNAWNYLGQTMRYFTKYPDLAPSGYATLSHVGHAEITCPVGEDLKMLPLAESIYLSINFVLTVPILVADSED